MPLIDPAPLIAKAPVIPVLTIDRAADAAPLARALATGGLPVIEVTLRTRAALDAVHAIAAEVPDCVVGVGTVTRSADIPAALSAGAKYLVSPGTPPALAAALHELEAEAALADSRVGDDPDDLCASRKRPLERVIEYRHVSLTPDELRESPCS